jgi:two-component system, sensor histidine kinase
VTLSLEKVDDSPTGGDGPNGANALQIRFTVSDTGAGVPMHLRKRIFDEFEQGVASKVHAGTGLGLPLCRALVEAMGGSISMSCPESGGSKFSFELAMACADIKHAPISSTSPPSKAKAPLPEGLRILLADDQPLNIKILSQRLKRILKAPVFTTARTGEEALELLTRGSYDLAILDEIFGNDNDAALTGLGVTAAVREAGIKSGLGGELPIIGATGNETPRHTEMARSIGQAAVWGKPPPDPDKMVQDLRRVLPCAD